MQPPTEESIYDELKELTGVRAGDGHVLWHYTSWDGLQGIADKNEIWASNIQNLNDAREYKHGVEIIERFIDASIIAKDDLERRFNQRANLFYAVSLSGQFDALSQWRGYSGSTGGFALGFRRDALNALSSGFPVRPCH
jgi:hypothetical protein